MGKGGHHRACIAEPLGQPDRDLRIAPVGQEQHQPFDMAGRGIGFGITVHEQPEAVRLTELGQNLDLGHQGIAVQFAGACRLNHRLGQMQNRIGVDMGQGDLAVEGFRIERRLAVMRQRAGIVA